MAERRRLTIEIEADAKGIRVIGQEAKTAKQEVERLGTQGTASIEDLGSGVDSAGSSFLTMNSAILIASAGVVALTAGVVLFGRAVANASTEATFQINRLSATLDISTENARQLFPLITSFGVEIALNAKEALGAFNALSSQGLVPTAERLRSIQNASIGFGQSIESISDALQDLRPTNLRGLGVELEKSGDLARVSFRGISKEVQNTDQDIRQTILSLFGQELPDAVTTSEQSLDFAFARLRANVGNFLTSEGSELESRLAGIANNVNNWVIANETLIQQKISEAIEFISDSIVTVARVLGFTIDILKVFGTAAGLAFSVLDLAVQTSLVSIGGLSEGLGRVFSFFGIERGSALQDFGSSLKTNAGESAEIAALKVGELTSQLIENTLAVGTTADSLERLVTNANSGSASTDRLTKTSNLLNNALDDLDLTDRPGSIFNKETARNAKTEIDRLNDSLQSTIETLQENIRTLGLEGPARNAIIRNINIERGARSDLADELLRLQNIFDNDQALAAIKKETTELAIQRIELEQNAAAAGQYAAAMEIALLATNGYSAEVINNTNKLRQQQLVLARDKEFKNLISNLEDGNRALREETALIGLSAAERNKLIALFEVENQLRDTNNKLTDKQILKLREEGVELERLLNLEDETRKAQDQFIAVRDAGVSAFRDIIEEVRTGDFNNLPDLLEDIANRAGEIFINTLFDTIEQGIQDGTGVFEGIADLLNLGGNSSSNGAVPGGPIDVALDTGTDRTLDTIGTNTKNTAEAARRNTAVSIAIAGGIQALASALGGAAGGFSSQNVGGILSGLGGVSLGAANLFTGLAPILVPVGIGLAIAGIVGPIIFDAISNAFKDKPRLDIEVFGKGNINDLGTLIAPTVSDVIRLGVDEGFRLANITIETKAGGGDVGANEVLAKVIADSLNQVVDTIFAIVNQLPVDLASRLRDSLRNTQLNLRETEDDFALEFDETGKDLAEKFQLFVEEIQARFLTTLDTFFTTTVIALGVQAGIAEDFVEERLNEILETEGREERAALGQAFLEDIQAFVTAFNLSTGAFGSNAIVTLNSISTIAENLGFTAVPTIQQLNELAGAILETGEATPEAVAQIVQLRQAVISFTISLSQTIQNLAGIISGLSEFGANLNAAAAALSGAGDAVVGLLQQPGLGLDEREALVNELNNIVQAQLQIEQQAFQERIRRQQEGVRSQITAIQTVSRVRIEALNKELEIARRFERLVETIGNTLDNVLFGPNSALTGSEQISLLQARIADTQTQLASVADPEVQADLIERLATDLPLLLAETVSTFGINSPEAVAAFEATVGGLEDLQIQAAEAARSTEDILAEIQAIEASTESRIEALNNQISNLSNQQFVASSGLQSQIDVLISETTALLEENLALLEQGINTEEAIFIQDTNLLTATQEHTGLLQAIANNTAGAGQLQNTGGPNRPGRQFINIGGGGTLIPGFADGIGFVPKDMLAIIHRGERVLTREENLSSIGTSPGVSITIQIDATDRSIKEVMEEVENDANFGRLGEIINEKARRI